jgi:[protein-PII] uridylyltransferase
VGQCSTILFHVYTVDEHILMVIRNLRRFTEPQHAHEYPLCSRLIGDFERKELLYLAALSSTTSRKAAAAIIRRSARGCAPLLPRARPVGAGRDLVAWLVGEHLTSRRPRRSTDITDPASSRIRRKVGDERA